MKRLYLSLLISTLLISIAHTQTTCPIGQYYVPSTDTCVTSCPVSTYIGLFEQQNACLPQQTITATVQPTSEDRTFIVLFSGSPFVGVPPNQQSVNVILNDPNIVQGPPALSAVFNTKDQTILQVFVGAQEISSQTLISFIFPDLSTNNASQTFIINPAPITTVPSGQLTPNDLDQISMLSKLDRGLEYAWITLTCLSPYAHLYMNTKLYRETLEMFKRINLPYNKETTRFLRENNNKVSGFKGPNMFPILIEGHPVSSGWNRREENGLPFARIDADRVQDLKLPTSVPIRNYDAFPLFLDNYGIQITVFLGILTLIIIFELLNFVFCRRNVNPNQPSKKMRLFQGIRNFLRWNLLLASFIGSFQSLTFYFMAQMQTYDKEENGHSSHNKLNFWFAIGSIIIIGVLFPLFMIYKIRKMSVQSQINDPNKEQTLTHYGLFFMIYNPMRNKAFTFPFALMLRATVLAALTMFLPNDPTAQVASILAVTCAFVIYLIVLRPFTRTFHFVFQLLNEFALIFYLGTLTHLARKDAIVSEDTSETMGNIFIALWLFLPFLGVLFGIVDILIRIFAPHFIKSNKLQYVEAIPMPTENAQIESGNKIEILIKTPKAEQHSATPAKLRLSDLVSQVMGEEEFNQAKSTPKLPYVAQKGEPISYKNEVEIQVDLQEEAESLDNDEKDVPGTATQTEEFNPHPEFIHIPKKVDISRSYLDKVPTVIETIIEEEVDKEQASAELNPQNKQNFMFTNTNGTQTSSPGGNSASDQDLIVKENPQIYNEKPKNVAFMEPKEVPKSVAYLDPQDNIRLAHHYNSYNRDSYPNAPRSVSSDNDVPRTQDKVKATPFNLDTPVKNIQNVRYNIEDDYRRNNNEDNYMNRQEQNGWRNVEFSVRRSYNPRENNFMRSGFLEESEKKRNVYPSLDSYYPSLNMMGSTKPLNQDMNRSSGRKRIFDA